MFNKRIYDAKTRSYLKKSKAFTFLSAGATLYFASSSLKALKSWKSLTFSVALLNKFGLLWHSMIWCAIIILPYDACDSVIKSQWSNVDRGQLDDNYFVAQIDDLFHLEMTVTMRYPHMRLKTRVQERRKWKMVILILPKMMTMMLIMTMMLMIMSMMMTILKMGAPADHEGETEEGHFTAWKVWSNTSSNLNISSQLILLLIYFDIFNIFSTWLNLIKLWLKSLN